MVKEAYQTMTKLTTLLIVALLLSPMLTKATARLRPSTEKTQLRDGEELIDEIDNEESCEEVLIDEVDNEESCEEVLTDEIDNEESCEGGNKEKCLIKRTLVAHIDYIYTQKPPPQVPKA
ncbi:hypothetical protein TEA_025794 [Camellia sinensis var. sinensis]|uniref:Phytosulfokine n=1 Tax=Camellia sinensis var. sinensis TaxID=542762 RepID=A0A4S4ERJ2_CAMSN|nr:hypothetical protein TEA_025794 [Camellia sinensis var. sinensis]